MVTNIYIYINKQYCMNIGWQIGYQVVPGTAGTEVSKIRHGYRNQFAYENSWWVGKKWTEMKWYAWHEWHKTTCHEWMNEWKKEWMNEWTKDLKCMNWHEGIESNEVKFMNWNEWIDMNELKWVTWHEWFDMNVSKWMNWHEWLEINEVTWTNWSEWIEMKDLKWLHLLPASSSKGVLSRSVF